MNNKSWWVFFPFVGLNITDQEIGLDNPIFGDVAILSREHMEAVLRRNMSNLIPDGRLEQIIEWVKNPSFIEAQKDVVQSYLAVRRMGALEKNVDSVRNVDKPAIEAKKRAEEISALLTLIFLSCGMSGETCGLLEQIQFRTAQSITMISANYDGEFKFSNYPLNHSLSSSPVLLDSKSSIQISSNELKALLEQAEFSSFSSIMLNSKRIPKTSRQVLVQSCIRLTESVLSPSFSTQLLGAITAIEILLTFNSDSKFETIKKRTEILLGEKLYAQYETDLIFEARHEYVHKGKDVSRNISAKALALAFSCILSYSDIAHLFKRTEKISAYLDFLGASEKIKSEWDLEQQQIFQNMVKHTINRQALPFVSSLE